MAITIVLCQSIRRQNRCIFQSTDEIAENLRKSGVDMKTILRWTRTHCQLRSAVANARCHLSYLLWQKRDKVCIAVFSTKPVKLINLLYAKLNISVKWARLRTVWVSCPICPSTYQSIALSRFHLMLLRGHQASGNKATSMCIKHDRWCIQFQLT